MYNNNVRKAYLKHLSINDNCPKTAANLSEKNYISLPLCELLVNNAPDTDSIFYAIMDLKGVRRTVKRTSEYNQILNSADTLQKKELFEKLLKEETFNILELARGDSTVIDLLAKDLCV